ncbi:MAG: hypothetical protein JST64_05865, partial [Actinobacteria bacterium]|nr:hypothetical protein [Actinomycetota bacterium]
MSDRAAPVAAQPEVREFGTWPSALTPEVAAGGAVRVSSVGLAVASDGSTIVRWSEQRPDLGGRTVVCRDRRGSDGGSHGAATSSVPEGPVDMSARSGVNEYGGGSWWGDGERLFWVDGPSGAIVAIDTTGGAVRRVTEALADPGVGSVRHAAGVLTPDGAWIVCERELHPPDVGSGIGSEPINELAVVASAGGSAVTLVRDGDWASDPSISPDGTLVAWLRWDHPDMPWDAAEVWAGRLAVPGTEVDGTHPQLHDARRVAGGHAGGAARSLDRPVAACLPSWSPDGRLFWCDDAADWWHLRCAPMVGLPHEGAGDQGPPALDVSGEVGEPRWVSGGCRYGFLDDGRVVVALSRGGLDSVQVWDPSDGSLAPISSPEGGFTSVEHLAVRGTVVAVAGGGGACPTSAWSVDLRDGLLVDHRRVTRPDPAEVSTSRSITFPTADGEHAHGLFYPPRS